jgi:hypothetical protein
VANNLCVSFVGVKSQPLFIILYYVKLEKVIREDKEKKW